MVKPESSQKWVEAGYELFAFEGPDGVQVEKLARILGINKSGFYHYFGDREVYLASLMEYHYIITTIFYNEAKKATSFHPGYLDLLFKYKTSLLVQMHLRRHMYDPVFNDVFQRVASRNDKVLMPLWAEYLKIPGNHELASELWDILRDIFFIRMNKENFTKEFLYSIVYEFAHVLEVLKKYSSHNNDSFSGEKGQ